MTIDEPMVTEHSRDERDRTSAKKVILMDDPYHDWSRDIVEFRLTYEGLLPSAGNSNKQVQHKHHMRKVFHKQLRRLWDITPSLDNMLDIPASPVEVNRINWVKRREMLPQRFKCGNFDLLPLVTEDLGLLCSLDILFLRPDKPGLLIRSGDIDNRLKTLFDSLRNPGPDAIEVAGCEPTEDEKPLYCLLQDDRLITRVSVETDTLLQPTSPDRAAEPNDVRLIITVKLKPTDSSNFSTAHFI
jgi:hypothetical protein